MGLNNLAGKAFSIAVFEQGRCSLPLACAICVCLDVSKAFRFFVLGRVERRLLGEVERLPSSSFLHTVNAGCFFPTTFDELGRLIQLVFTLPE